MQPASGPGDPADPAALEVLGADRDAVQSLQQGPRRKYQGRPLGLWSEALPSTENYSPFEQQLVACRWALVD